MVVQKLKKKLDLAEVVISKLILKWQLIRTWKECMLNLLLKSVELRND
jgi:hypothetical protein